MTASAVSLHPRPSRTGASRLAAVTRRAALCAALGLAAPFALPVQAAAPMVKTQAPGFFRMMLGDFEVTALSDGTVDLPVDTLLRDPPGRTQAALAKAHLATPLPTSVNAFLINTGERLVLVDVGAGGLFGPTLGGLVANLRAAGYQPEQVDDVLLTHLHPDHVGGLAAQGAAVFTNATVHADQRDADQWLSTAKLQAAPPATKPFHEGAIASLAPYVGGGRFKPFKADGTVVPGVRSTGAYGHTEGHTVYTVESRGQKLVLVGDLIHVGAVQLERPEVTINFDTDPKRAMSARQKVFAEAARDGAVVGASHLQFPGLGRLQPAGRAYRWVPVNYLTQLK